MCLGVHGPCPVGGRAKALTGGQTMALSLLLNHGELSTLGFASLSLYFSSYKMGKVVSALWAGGKRCCKERARVSASQNLDVLYA